MQVDDILGEESDNDSEGKEKEERVEGEEEDEETSRQSAEPADYQQALCTSVKDPASTAKEDSRQTGSIARYYAWVRPFKRTQAANNFKYYSVYAHNI